MANAKLRKYELIYLVHPEASDEERTRVAGRVNQVLEEYGAHPVSNEDWGKRKLAYEIQKFNKAYYTYMVFITKPGTTQEIERVLRMLDSCVRFQTIKLLDGIDPDHLDRYLPEPEAPAETKEQTDA
jgi:small subunit ribosomal protein S6